MLRRNPAVSPMPEPPIETEDLTKAPPFAGQGSAA
jgi:hypothetical protein